MPDRSSESRAVEETLSKPDVHAKWEDDYRTTANASFYDAAMRLVGAEVDPMKRPNLLDAGCGACDYTIRLARQGFTVTAVDFSEAVLHQARRTLERERLDARVRLARENLLNLTFPPGSFDAVLCWGVLMHIPDVGTALAELTRVLRPGGMLVVSETNMHSLESRSLRLARRLIRGGRVRERMTLAGFERWTQGAAGELVTRECNIPWLIRQLEERGFGLRSRVAGQFSESYVRTQSSVLKRGIHAFNDFWFHSVRWPGPAMANILFFQRDAV